MQQPFSWVMLFLTFIKGPDIQEWTNMQVSWIGSQLLAGAGRNEEHLYDEVMDSFKTVFTDTMSLQKAKAEFRTLKMEKANLTCTFPSSKGSLGWQATTFKTRWCLTDSAVA